MPGRKTPATNTYYHFRVRRSQLEASALASQSRSEQPCARPAAASCAALLFTSITLGCIQPHETAINLETIKGRQRPIAARINSCQPASTRVSLRLCASVCSHSRESRPLLMMDVHRVAV